MAVHPLCLCCPALVVVPVYQGKAPNQMEDMTETISPQLSELLKQSAAEPDDALLRMAAADTAEEEGKIYWAEALRWMAKHSRRADYDDSKAGGGYTWWFAASGEREKHRLPSHVCSGFYRAWHWHTTAAQAEMALLLDWEELRMKGIEFERD